MPASALSWQRYGAPKLDATTVRVALSTTAARSTQLARGIYRMILDVDSFVLQGDATVTASAASDAICVGGQEYHFVVEDPATDGYLSIVAGAGTGTAYLTQVAEVI